MCELPDPITAFDGTILYTQAHPLTGVRSGCQAAAVLRIALMHVKTVPGGIAAAGTSGRNVCWIRCLVRCTVLGKGRTTQQEKFTKQTHTPKDRCSP
jgi:hypothetical protein